MVYFAHGILRCSYVLQHRKKKEGVGGDVQRYISGHRALTSPQLPAVTGDRSSPVTATPEGRGVGADRSGSVPWCSGERVVGNSSPRCCSGTLGVES